MMTQIIYVARNNGGWGTATHKDKSDFSAAFDGTLKAALNKAWERSVMLAPTGVACEIYLEQPDGTFKLHIED